MALSVNNLLWLLHWLLRASVLAQIGGLGGPPDEHLDRLPCLTKLGRGTLIRDQCIDPCRSSVESTLYKVTLAVTRPEEDGVDEQQDPAALGKGDCRKEYAEPEGDFQPGDEGHGSIVVLLYESANGIC